MENGKWLMLNGNKYNLTMKTINKIFAILLMLIIVKPDVKAQSVDSLVNEALRNNPQIKAFESKIKSAEFKSETSGFLPPPTLGIEFQQVPFSDPNPITKALSQNISLSQMFMPGGKLSAMTEAERKNIAIAQANFDSFRFQLVSQVKTKYYEIWMIEHHLELRDEIDDLLNGLLQSNEQLYTTGNAKYSDILMIKAEIAANRTKAKTFEDEYSAAVYNMNALLGRELDNNDLQVQHNWETDSLVYSQEEIINFLTEQNPQLKKMESMIDMNRLEITANKKELIPDVMVQAMVMRMPQGMILTSSVPMSEIGMGETEYMYSLMASVTLPFAPWSSGKYKNKEQELTSSISGLSSERTSMQRQMISELKGMIKQLESTNKEINLYTNEVIPLYKEALHAQLTEYQNGMVSINQLISTMQMLNMKEEELSESQMKHQMLIGEISSMVGLNVGTTHNSYRN